MSSPIVNIELQTWKIDCVVSLGMAIAFLLPIIVPFAWFQRLTPYLDQIITIVLSAFMLPTPIKTVITGLRDLMLWPPEAETLDDIKATIEPIIGGYGHKNLYYDIVRTGRKLWISVYITFDRDIISLSKFQILQTKCIAALAEKYPESYDHAVPDDLVYSGQYRLTDSVDGAPVVAGKLVLSPTRTYAPVIKKMLDELRPEIHGMVHCTGGAQTKVLHFVNDNCKVVKDNMFPVPPLFKAIHDCSATDWKEMYQVFNMGHRMEIYVRPEMAERIIAISKEFNIDAQVVGHIEDGKRSLTIESEFGTFNYEG